MSKSELEEDHRARWGRAHQTYGTEHAASAPLPALPPSQGFETPSQLAAQRGMIDFYIRGDPPNSSGINKLRCLLQMWQALKTKREHTEYKYGKHWVAALETVLGRSFLVRALLDTKAVENKLTMALENTGRIEKQMRTERNLRIAAEASASRAELDKFMDAPVGWVYRERKAKPAVYVETATGQTSTKNPRAAHLLGAIKQHADDGNRLRKRVRELEAESVRGNNLVACAVCRQLLSGDRPGGNGRFVFVESVACNLCDPSAYYCNGCAKEKGWKITRTQSVCPCATKSK